MGTGIYKSVKKVVNKQVTYTKVELKATEVKNYIMKANNWTSEQYNKKYDILRNKLRAYENYQRAHGENVKTQSVRELLYKEAKSKRAYGKNYKPSLQLERIKSFTSISSGKSKDYSKLSKSYKNKRTATFGTTTHKRFKGLLENNGVAQRIYKEIKDPVKREKALTDYANKLHLKIDEESKIAKEQTFDGVPFGERTGSDTSIDFDIEAYK